MLQTPAGGNVDTRQPNSSSFPRVLDELPRRFERVVVVEQADPEGGERADALPGSTVGAAHFFRLIAAMLLIAIGQPTPDFDALALRFPGYICVSCRHLISVQRLRIPIRIEVMGPSGSKELELCACTRVCVYWLGQ